MSVDNSSLLEVRTDQVVSVLENAKQGKATEEDGMLMVVLNNISSIIMMYKYII